MISTNANVESWKSNVPESWSIIPLKFITSYNDEKLSELSDPDLIFDYIDIGSVSYENGIETVQRCCFKDAPSRARRVVRENDVILSTVRTYLKAGAIIPEHDRLMIVSTGFITIRAKETILSQYLKYLILSHGFVSEVECRSYGSNYPAINPVEIENITVPLPDIKSQESITSFLDARCSSIDSAISKHQQIIEKLEEYRKAVITQAVTKGLNQNVEMKYSCIPWVTSIPEKWSEQPLKLLFSNRKNKNTDCAETNLLSLSYGRIIRKDINSNEGLLPENFSGYNIIEPNDIVLRLTDLQNDHRSLRTGLVTEHGIITSAYVTLCPKANINSEYYHYLLHAYDVQKVFYTLGEGIRQSLKYEDLGKVLVPVPPRVEQDEIVHYLNAMSKMVDDVIDKHNQLISKLQEYKQSLIYNAVTGKIDCTTEA